MFFSPQIYFYFYQILFSSTLLDSILMVSLDFNNQKVFSFYLFVFPEILLLHFLLNKWSFCGLIFTVTCPYRVLIQVYWPTFDLLIQKFHDIPCYTVNSVFMTGFCITYCGNHRSPTISYTLNSVNYYPFILTIVIGSNEKNKNKKNIYIYIYIYY